jgi:hypothetical protein
MKNRVVEDHRVQCEPDSVSIAHAQRVVRQIGDVTEYRCFQRAITTIGTLQESKRIAMLTEGQKAVSRATGLSSHFSQVLVELFLHGSSPALKRIRNSLQPLQLFQTVPGIGPGLATRLVNKFKLETLDDLWLAIQLNVISISDLRGNLRTIETLLQRRAAL